METVFQDLKLALRVLAKQRAFAAIVTLTIALAIGVNTLIFSFVNFFVLRPMPFKDMDLLVFVSGSHPDRGSDRVRVSYADFLEWRSSARSFEEMGAITTRNFNMTGAGEPLRVVGRPASASQFPVWGLGTEIGRVFRAEDDRAGAGRVALLSHGFWQRHFGGDKGVLGRGIRLDGESHTVVGVVSREIEIGNFSEIDVWVPLALYADPNDRIRREYSVTARLKPGVELQTARAELLTIAARQQQQHKDTHAGWSAHVVPLRTAITGANTWAVLALLAVAVSFVLAIACANVANLMLVRATARTRESAVRAALGASRVRLLRPLLTEGLLLSLAGGVLGLLFADWGLRIIRSVTFEQFFQLVVIDRRVLLFSALVSLLAPVVFGLAPALQASRTDLLAALRDGARAFGGRATTRSRGALVVLQMSLASALLVVAVLALRSAHALQNLDPGYAYKGLVTFQVDLPAAKYPHDDQVRAFFTEFLERIRTAPGANAVAAGTGIPVVEGVATTPLMVEGRQPEAAAVPLAVRSVVSPAYLEALGIPLLAGRGLGPQDGVGAPPVVVVNRALVSRHLSGREPLGARIRLGPAGGPEPWRVVVGVAQNLMNSQLNQPTQPQAWIPLGQAPSRSLAIFVRSPETDGVLRLARSELKRLDPDLALHDAKTVERALYEDLASNRVIAGLFATFAAVALTLATIGLYGVVAYAVTQRTAEIAMRVALGAQRGDVLRLVLGHGGRLLLLGLGLGILTGGGLARTLAGLLYGVSATDPLTFSLVPGLLVLAALLALLVPARRALRVDPMAALRAE